MIKAEDHAKVADILQGIRAELSIADPSDCETVLFIAEHAYGQLVDRDVQWAKSAEKVRLKPA